MSTPTTPYERPVPPWLEKTRGQATAAELVLWAALEEVEDPEYPISVVDMGLIYDVKLDGRAVQVNLSFTSMGCPCMEYIIDDVRERLLQEPTVDNVDMQIVWDPPWTRQRLTERGKEKLKAWGISV
ncbi:MAG: metal-sulfur cluster assembly factor [Anaerolineales bacterium]|nr:metal-sulfur cluster assembly factor [Anaerolineales bacterium]